MGLSVTNIESQMLAEEQANLTEDISIIGIEEQHLALKAGYLYQEYSEMLEKEALASGVEADADIDTVEEFNWDIFKHEYDVAQTKLDNQEKQLELQKTDKQNKLNIVTNLLESAEKRKDKCIENSMKGIES